MLHPVRVVGITLLIMAVISLLVFRYFVQKREKQRELDEKYLRDGKGLLTSHEGVEEILKFKFKIKQEQQPLVTGTSHMDLTLTRIEEEQENQGKEESQTIVPQSPPSSYLCQIESVTGDGREKEEKNRKGTTPTPSNSHT